MATYRIMTHPVHATIALKQGWTWWGSLLPGPWALFHRMWLLGIAVIASSWILFYFLLRVSTEEVYSWLTDGFLMGPTYVMIGLFGSRGLDQAFPDPRILVQSYWNIVLFIFVGQTGLRYRYANLLSRGYTHIGTVEARNADHALALYSEQR